MSYPGQQSQSSNTYRKANNQNFYQQSFGRPQYNQQQYGQSQQFIQSPHNPHQISQPPYNQNLNQYQPPQQYVHHRGDIQWAPPPNNYMQQNSQMISNCTGNKKALLIGIKYLSYLNNSYKGTRSELRGCVNDVKSIKNFLTNNVNTLKLFSNYYSLDGETILKLSCV